MEAAHLELIQMPSTIHLKQLEVGGNGERFGDHMVTHPQEGQKALEWAGIHENFVRICMIRILVQINTSEEGSSDAQMHHSICRFSLEVQQTSSRWGQLLQPLFEI